MFVQKMMMVDGRGRCIGRILGKNQQNQQITKGKRPEKMRPRSFYTLFLYPSGALSKFLFMDVNHEMSLLSMADLMASMKTLHIATDTRHKAVESVARRDRPNLFSFLSFDR